MLRFIGMMIMLALVFGLGYYTGQRPIGDLKHTIVDLSRKVGSLSKSAVDTTLGLERDLRWHQGLVDAKEKLIQAKSELLDRNFGSAAKELAEAEEYLDKANRAEESGGRAAKLKPLLEKIRAARADLATGKALARGKLEEIQQELDTVIGR
jgi:hypothetical protein